MKTYERLLATLLHYANANASWCGRNDLYALKEKLLRRYGELAGQDIQEIRRECWGPFNDWGDPTGCPGEDCPRCGGTGIYDLKYIRLERWAWSGYVFHRPAERLYRLPDPASVNIHGRIEHPDYDVRTSSEAALWLYLLSGERRLFWRTLKRSRFHRPGLRPLLILQALVMTLAMWLSWQKCWCGRWFPTWGTGWQVCRKCRDPKPFRVYASDGVFDDGETPF